MNSSFWGIALAPGLSPRVWTSLKTSLTHTLERHWPEMQSALTVHAASVAARQTLFEHTPLAQSVPMLHWTQAPMLLQKPVLHTVPCGLLGCEGTPPVQTSVVHSLPSSAG